MELFESDRLSAVSKHLEFNAQSDSDLELLCRAAALVCDAPMAAVSWVGANEQWFQSAYGVPTGKLPREGLPCSEVAGSDQNLLIEDFAASAKWQNNPLTQLGLKAYFGVPMIDSEGKTLGSFCVMDTQPRAISSMQIQTLEIFAKLVVSQIEQRGRFGGLERDLKDRAPLVNLGMVAGGLVHEISSPLTALIFRCSQARAALEEGRADVGEQIARSEALAERMLKIVRAVRGLAETPGECPTEEVAFSSVVEQMLLAVQGELKRLRIGFYFDIAPKIAVIANETFLTQILINLFNNAAHAIEALPERWVELSAQICADDPAVVEIRFRDSGHGIALSLRDRITQSFFTTKKDRGGLGLGLSLCLSFAEQMKGSLNLDAADKHTCFVVKLPAAI